MLSRAHDNSTRLYLLFFFSSRRRHTRLQGDWSSDVCSSDLDDGQTDHRQHDVEDGGDLAQQNELGKHEARKRAGGHVAARVDEGRGGRGDVIKEALRKQSGDGHPLHGGAQNAALALHHDENRAGDLDETEATENPADGGRDGVQSQEVQRGLREEAGYQNQAGGGVSSESPRSGGGRRGGRGSSNRAGRVAFNGLGPVGFERALHFVDPGFHFVQEFARSPGPIERRQRVVADRGVQAAGAAKEERENQPQTGQDGGHGPPGDAENGGQKK